MNKIIPRRINDYKLQIHESGKKNNSLSHEGNFEVSPTRLKDYMPIHSGIKNINKPPCSSSSMRQSFNGVGKRIESTKNTRNNHKDEDLRLSPKLKIDYKKKLENHDLTKRKHTDDKAKNSSYETIKKSDSCKNITFESETNPIKQKNLLSPPDRTNNNDSYSIQHYEQLLLNNANVPKTTKNFELKPIKYFYTDRDSENETKLINNNEKYMISYGMDNKPPVNIDNDMMIKTYLDKRFENILNDNAEIFKLDDPLLDSYIQLDDIISINKDLCLIENDFMNNEDGFLANKKEENDINRQDNEIIKTNNDCLSNEILNLSQKTNIIDKLKRCSDEINPGIIKHWKNISKPSNEFIICSNAFLYLFAGTIPELPEMLLKQQAISWNYIKAFYGLPNKIMCLIKLFTSFCDKNIIKKQNIIKSRAKLSSINKNLNISDDPEKSLELYNYLRACDEYYTIRYKRDIIKNSILNKCFSKTNKNYQKAILKPKRFRNNLTKSYNLSTDISGRKSHSLSKEASRIMTQSTTIHHKRYSSYDSINGYSKGGININNAMKKGYDHHRKMASIDLMNNNNSGNDNGSGSSSNGNSNNNLLNRTSKENNYYSPMKILRTPHNNTSITLSDQSTPYKKKSHNGNNNNYSVDKKNNSNSNQTIIRQSMSLSPSRLSINSNSNNNSSHNKVNKKYSRDNTHVIESISKPNYMTQQRNEMKLKYHHIGQNYDFRSNTTVQQKSQIISEQNNNYNSSNISDGLSKLILSTKKIMENNSFMSLIEELSQKDISQKDTEAEEIEKYDQEIQLLQLEVKKLIMNHEKIAQKIQQKINISRLNLEEHHKDKLKEFLSKKIKEEEEMEITQRHNKKISLDKLKLKNLSVKEDFIAGNTSKTQNSQFLSTVRNDQITEDFEEKIGIQK